MPFIKEKEEDNKEKKTRRIFFIFLVFAIILSGLIYYQCRNDINKTVLSNKAKEIKIYVNGLELKDGKINTIVVEKLNPTLIIKYDDIKNISLSIDGSLNVLGDQFYGSTQFSQKEVMFIPDFIITPGKHHLGIKNIVNDKLWQISFVVTYKESFERSFKNNGIWIIPKGSSPEWFIIKNDKLEVMPRDDASHVSFAFAYTLDKDFSIDLELMPIGENISTVLYLIDSIDLVRNEFVIGSNGNKKNILFHSYAGQRKRIDGSDYEYSGGKRYHFRLSNSNRVIAFFLRELQMDQIVDPMLQIDNFQEVFRYEDSDKEKYSKNSPYYFGISVWQNSSGINIDDIYITNFGNIVDYE